VALDDFTAGDFPTAAEMNMIPRGILGRTVATNTSYTNASASYTAVTASAGTAPALTLSLSTSRMYRARFHGRFLNASGTFILLGFHEATTLRDAWQYTADIAAAGTLDAEWVFSPASASSVTYDVRVALNGSGTVTASANAQFPMVFTIEDLGLA